MCTLSQYIGVHGGVHGGVVYTGVYGVYTGSEKRRFEQFLKRARRVSPGRLEPLVRQHFSSGNIPVRQLFSSGNYSRPESNF